MKFGKDGKFLKWLKQLIDKFHIHLNLNLDLIGNEKSLKYTHFQELELLPLDEVEKLVVEQASEQQQAQTKLSNKSEPSPHVADLSSNFPLPPLITCYTMAGQSDPNLRITHYPPSNCLH